MVFKKATSKPSNNSTKLAVKSTSTTLVLSAFSPPSVKLSLFASVVTALDAPRLRIQDINTGRLRCEHTFTKGVSVASMEWGALPGLGEEEDGARKKRKRAADGEPAKTKERAVVGLALSNGDILLYGVTEAAIVKTLSGEHVGAVRSFTFCKQQRGRGWSVGNDGKAVEWDLVGGGCISNIPLPDKQIRRVVDFPPNIICAGQTIWAIDPKKASDTAFSKFAANTTPIHSILSSYRDSDHFLAAADSDRYINVFSLEKEKHIGALVAEADVRVVRLSRSDHSEMLLVVTADGAVEIFTKPFDLSQDENAATSRKRKTLTRPGEAKVRVVRPGSKEVVHISDAAIQDEELVVAWVERGVNVEFHKIRWTNPEDGSLVLSGTIDLELTKAVTLTNGINGVKDMGKTHVDQAGALVTSGSNLQDVDMKDAGSDAEDANVDDDERMASASESEPEAEDDDDDDAVEEPSFAERFQQLEVSAKLPTAASTAVSKKAGTSAPVTAGALTATLSQALKTSDTALLETCLHTNDSEIIRDTVQKLPPRMTVALLERIAERLARKPGRTATLNQWVYWTFIIHGGYLVTLPDLMRSMNSLQSTITTRGAALPRLLQLQGRLNMLRGQVDLRNSQRNAEAVAGVEDEVIYIEGQDDDASSSSEDEDQVEDASFITSRTELDAESDEEDDRDLNMILLEEDEQREAEEQEFMDSDDQGADEMFLDLEAEESDDGDNEEEEEEEDIELRTGRAESVDFSDADNSADEDEDETPRPKKGKAAR